MKVLHKYICLLLCLSMSTYTLPVFAAASLAGTAQAETVFKTELSDQAMQMLVGGSGNVDATMSEYIKYDPNLPPVAQAVVTNRSTITVPYVLEVMTMQGESLEELASGNLAPGETKVISGIATVADKSSVRVKVGQSYGPSAVDTAYLITKR